MRGVNKVLLVGYTGKDVEVKSTKNGAVMGRTSIAVADAWKDTQGNKQERTEWVPLVFFGKKAEVAGQYLRKGSLVHVEGKLQTSSWQDETGKKHYRTDVFVHEFTILRYGEQSQSANEEFEPQPQFDDDIPF